MNTFSPEGRLFQVEYAIEAIKVFNTLNQATCECKRRESVRVFRFSKNIVRRHIIKRVLVQKYALKSGIYIFFINPGFAVKFRSMHRKPSRCCALLYSNAPLTLAVGFDSHRHSDVGRSVSRRGEEDHLSLDGAQQHREDRRDRRSHR